MPGMLLCWGFACLFFCFQMLTTKLVTIPTRNKICILVENKIVKLHYISDLYIKFILKAGVDS